MPRSDHRSADQLRPLTIEAHIAPHASGSVLLGFGATRVICAATIEATSEALRKVFGRSLKLRQVSAGGCNGCELELNALANVNFDLQRYGIEWVASPRHADALVLTGPVSGHMADAVQLAWDAMPSPRFLIAFGACALSGGLYADSIELDRSFLDRFSPSLLVPGCPPHPLTFVQGILDLLGIR